jgi:hypothetical protein
MIAKTACLVAIVAVFGSGCASSPSPKALDEPVRIERSDKEFDLPKGVTRVAIDNPWGEINIRGRDEREVGIHAVVQRLPPRFAPARFTSRREGSTLHIGVSMDGASAGANPVQGRVDIAVYLPGDLALTLGTRDGRIAAKRRNAPVEATSQSGDLLVSSRDRLTLHSSSGQIRAVAIGGHWQGRSLISTDTGRIVLMVPTFGDIALDAQTGGRLGNDFGLSVVRLGGGLSEARARYGGGTSPLEVRSRSGELVLEQLVLMGEDKGDQDDDD